jgi:hypothetical protein
LKLRHKEVEYTIIQEEYSNHYHTWFFPWKNEIIEKYDTPSLSKIRMIMNEYIKKEISKKDLDEIEKETLKIKEDLQRMNL